MSNAFEEGLNPKPRTPLERLRSMSTVSRVDDMKKNLENEFYVFDGLALDGQMTLFYAKPNTGKTLIFLRLIIDAIQDGRIKAEDVFYINADDSYRGLTTKSEIAKKHGFEMISPAEAGLSPQEIISLLDEISQTNEAKGKVIVLDTLKKFADMMNKSSQKALYESLRKLTTNNATIIIAGHANKKLEDDKLIYEGTSDTMNDIDCAYSINLMTEPEGDVVVEFRREKSRGDNTAKVSFGYKRSSGMSYQQLLDTVYKLDDSQVVRVKSLSDIQQKMNRYESEALFIKTILKDGVMNQTEILQAYAKDEAAREEFSKSSLKKCLNDLADIVWTVTRDYSKNNIKQFAIIKPTTEENAKQHGGCKTRKPKSQSEH